MVKKNELPASHFSQGDLKLNVRCISKILNGQRKPSRWIEYFAGFGGVTDQLKVDWPGTPCELWDMDKSCYDTLRKKFPTDVVALGDSTKLATPKSGDAVILDYSCITLITIKLDVICLHRIFSKSPCLVTIADSGVNKLHLNWKAYGCSDDSRATYYQGYHELINTVWGYHLHKVAHHSRAAFMLFCPSKPSKRIIYPREIR